jgi:MbtH protein
MAAIFVVPCFGEVFRRSSLDENSLYRVVVNDEAQYSIWPDERAIPAGWRDAGKQGTKQECLDWIKEVWTDMRPLSLRQWMDEHRE